MSLSLFIFPLKTPRHKIIRKIIKLILKFFKKDNVKIVIINKKNAVLSELKNIIIKLMNDK